MTNINPARFFPETIELFESAGPVSPKYQYITHVKITAKKERIELSYMNRSKYMDGKPEKHTDFTRQLTPEEYESLWRELEAGDVFSLNRDWVGPTLRRRKGISFNFFEIKLGSGRGVRFDYLTRQREKDDFAPYQKVLTIIKNLSNMEN